jgi:uncharacterized protein YdiU (UPF0061 family)
MKWLVKPMTDKEFTYSEIMYALKQCQHGGNCDICSLRKHYITHDDKECIGLLHKGLTELINRQNAEYKDLQKQFRYLDIECERLEKENESQNAEIERLKDFIKSGGTDFTNMFCNVEKLETIKTAKSEAYKEFEERLKRELPEWLHLYINTIRKEMTGEE